MLKESQKPRQRKVFFLLLTLLILLSAVRYALQIDIPRFVFVLVIVCIALFGDKNEIIAICICCIPLHESIDLFYSIVFIVCIYVMKYFREIRINMSVILVLCMIVWELFHCLGSSFSVVGFLTSVIPLIALVVVMCSDLKDLDYPFVVRAFSLATLGVCATLLVKVLYLSGFNILAAVAGLQRLGLDTAEASENVTVSGGQVNPNTLGIISVLASTGLLQIRNMNKGRRSDILIACTLMFFGALTASRTYLVCLAFMVVMMIIAQQGSIARKLRFLGMVVLLVAAALLVLQLCFPDLLQYYISRFFELDITTGRKDLVTAYNEFLVSRPRVLCFGIGLQDYGTRLTQVYRIAAQIPHNALQELFIAWGLPGAVFFAALIVSMYQSAGAFSRRPALMNSIPLLLILVKGLAGQMLTSPYTMLAFAYAYLSLHAELRPVEKSVYFPEHKFQSVRPGVI